jgi:peptidoglycan DL-endopeptidase CwlO
MGGPPYASWMRIGVLALTLTVGVSFAGCAARAHRPPPADPLLARHHGPVVATAESPAGGGEGLIPPARRTTVAATRTRLVETSSGLVGAHTPVVGGRRHRADCSGFVQAVYGDIGVDLFADGGAPGENGVAIIYRFVAERGGLHARRPLPGDLVFFDDTYDRAGNGRRGDRLTHIGIVESLEADGTVVFVHLMQGRIVRSRMNRHAPAVHDDPETGRRQNDYLRRDDGSGPRLAAELFSAYGTVVR